LLPLAEAVAVVEVVGRRAAGVGVVEAVAGAVAAVVTQVRAAKMAVIAAVVRAVVARAVVGRAQAVLEMAVEVDEAGGTAMVDSWEVAGATTEAGARAAQEGRMAALQDDGPCV
jgi:hypothetical protein